MTINQYSCGGYGEGEDGGGAAGFRRAGDRRFWMAWAHAGDIGIIRGVMDDFGTLVETDR